MDAHIILVGIRLATVAAGLVLAYLSYRAYMGKRRESESLLALSGAFVLITLGVVVEGVLFEFLDIGLLEARTVESAILILGLAMVIYAIHQQA